jgi:hypothetical protein
MPNARNIDNVLLFREDLSPFLTHLTRDYGSNSAKENLVSILEDSMLRYGKPISDARWGMALSKQTPEIKKRLFTAISFTETPLNEIHCLLEIAGRQVKLKPYGLVFLKGHCMKRGASPVIYLNNIKGDKDKLVESLCDIADTSLVRASKILPFISFFGDFLTPAGGTPQNHAPVDFTWEREWRYVSYKQRFKFKASDIFVGLCPDDEIQEFEDQSDDDFNGLSFIDPTKPLKWYGDKLVKARKRSRLKNSVV